MTLSLNHVSIPTTEMEESTAFYEALGFRRGFARNEDGKITFLQMRQDPCFVEFLVSAESPLGHFGLACQKMELILDRLSATGIEPDAPSRRGQSGVRFVVFTDQAGNRVEITAP